MSRMGYVGEVFDARKEKNGIRRKAIEDYRDQLQIGQTVKVIEQAVDGDSVRDIKHRTFKGTIKYIHTHHVVVDNGTWRKSFTYIELMQPKTKVTIS